MDRTALSKLINEAAKYLADATPQQRIRLHEKLVNVRKKLALENKQQKTADTNKNISADFLEEC